MEVKINISPISIALSMLLAAWSDVAAAVTLLMVSMAADLLMAVIRSCQGPDPAAKFSLNKLGEGLAKKVGILIAVGLISIVQVEFTRVGVDVGIPLLLSKLPFSQAICYLFVVKEVLSVLRHLSFMGVEAPFLEPLVLRLQKFLGEPEEIAPAKDL